MSTLSSKFRILLTSKKNIILLIILITSILYFLYNSFSRNLPITRYDEEEWVGDAYYFQYYIHKNYDPEIWKTTSSKDQPMLVKLAFGAWLYPTYLKSGYNTTKIDYEEYLILNNFSPSNGRPKYVSLVKSLGDRFIKIPDDFSGLTKDLISKYGPAINGNLTLINKARELNLYVLILAVIIPSLFFFKKKGFLFGLLFLFFYSLNPLIINYGLLAQSEALFLLFFNTSIIVLLEYFLTNRKYNYLLVYSILTGFCFSTKLNGIMLIFIHVILEYVYLVKSFTYYKLQRSVTNLVTSIFVIVTIFIVLNPYTHSNSISSISEMFNHRQNVVNAQKILYSNQNVGSLGNRYLYILQSFFNQNYILMTNNVIFNNKINYHGPILLILFMIGVYKEVVSKRKISRLIFFVFLTVTLITGVYVQISWIRYLIHLVLFVIYYEVLGTIYCFDFIYKYLLKYKKL